MTGTEKTVFITGLVLVMGYPLAFLLIGLEWFLLAVYILTLVSFYFTLQRSYCSECMNFACPLNLTDEKVRAAFFERNPAVARAWGRSGD